MLLEAINGQNIISNLTSHLFSNLTIFIITHFKSHATAVKVLEEIQVFKAKNKL